MGDWAGYLRLMASAKTGVSGNVVAGGAVAVWAALGVLLWLSITLFIWIALGLTWNQWVLAGLVLSGLYFLIALVAGIAGVVARRRTQERAEAALTARKAAAALINPSILTMGLEVGRAIGWRRLISLAGVALLASGLAKEWLARKGESPPAEDS